MLKRWQKIALASVATGAALFTASFLLPPEYQICTPNEYTHAKECAQHHPGPFVFLWVIAVIDAHNGLFTAIATIAIATFTLILWRATDGTLRATNRSADVAERALTELEQPVVIPEIRTPGIEISGQPKGLTFGVLNYSFANYGRTPAFLIELKEDLYLPTKTGDLPKPFVPEKDEGQKMPWGVVSPPQGKSIEFSRTVWPFKNNTAALPDMAAGVGELQERGIVWHGYVKYKDIFRGNTVTGFCFWYHVGWGRWITAGGDDLNYSRKHQA